MLFPVLANAFHVTLYTYVGLMTCGLMNRKQNLCCFWCTRINGMDRQAPHAVPVLERIKSLKLQSSQHSLMWHTQGAESNLCCHRLIRCGQATTTTTETTSREIIASWSALHLKERKSIEWVWKSQELTRNTKRHIGNVRSKPDGNG